MLPKRVLRPSQSWEMVNNIDDIVFNVRYYWSLLRKVSSFIKFSVTRPQHCAFELLENKKRVNKYPKIFASWERKITENKSKYDSAYYEKSKVNSTVFFKRKRCSLSDDIQKECENIKKGVKKKKTPDISPVAEYCFVYYYYEFLNPFDYL